MTANHKTAPAATATAVADPTATPTPVVVLTASQVVIVDELKHVRRHVKTLEGREKELGAEVKGWLRGSGGGVGPDGELLASVAERAGRRTIDYARLASDFPEAYAACVGQGNAAEVLTLH